jgi:hypothetical protein
MSTYCFDVDGTICTLTENHNYQDAQPIQEMVDKINKLHSEGHVIRIATARGQISGMEWEDFTKEQLDEWGVKYDEFCSKPAADFYIDDLAVTPEIFLGDCERQYIEDEEEQCREFKKVNVDKNDVLIFRIPWPPPGSKIRGLVNAIKEVFPNNKFLIIPSDCDLSDVITILDK